MLLEVKDKTKKEYIIPDSVTSIGERSFYGCDSLRNTNPIASLQNILKALNITQDIDLENSQGIYTATKLILNKLTSMKQEISEKSNKEPAENTNPEV